MRYYLPITFLLVAVGTSVHGRTGMMDDLLRLRTNLLTNYTRDVRPAYNLSDVVHIDVSLFLLSILDFDELSGVITLSAGITLAWRDYRLQWTPSEYGGIDNILLNSSTVWKPKVYLVSSASDLEQFGSEQFDLRLYNTGDCLVSPGKLIKSSCSVDMRKFPTDSQVCEMLLLLWATLPDEVKMIHTANTFYMEYYRENGEWQIDKTSVYPSINFPDIMTFALHIRRKSMYFIISIMVPVVMLCLLNPFVFYLPASSGERISYIITMFLSLAVYMTLIGDNMPKVSENMAGMSYFMLIGLLYSCVLIVLTIFTLRCNAVNDVTRFPKWLRKLTRSLNKDKKNRVIPISQNNVDDVTENVEKEKNVSAVDDDVIFVEKDDVINVIDKLLFCLSLLAIVGVIVWFFVNYYV